MNTLRVEVAIVREQVVGVGRERDARPFFEIDGSNEFPFAGRAR